MNMFGERAARLIRFSLELSSGDPVGKAITSKREASAERCRAKACFLLLLALPALILESDLYVQHLKLFI